MCYFIAIDIETVCTFGGRQREGSEELTETSKNKREFVYNNGAKTGGLRQTPTGPAGSGRAGGADGSLGAVCCLAGPAGKGPSMADVSRGSGGAAGRLTAPTASSTWKAPRRPGKGLSCGFFPEWAVFSPKFP